MSATNIFGVGAVESATCPNRLEQRLIVAEGSVPRFEDTDDGFHAANRVPGRFQVSKRFAKAQPDSPDQRFAYEVFDGNGEITFESDTAWVCTLRVRTLVSNSRRSSSKMVEEYRVLRFSDFSKTVDRWPTPKPSF